MYPPLTLANSIRLENFSDKWPIKEYLIQMAAGDDLMIRGVYCDPTFGTERYDGPYKDFSHIVHSQWRMLYKHATGFDPDRDVFNRSNRSTVMDCLFNMVAIDRWRKHMKAYRFDPELELTLADVEEVRVPMSMLDRLPYDNFYVEFAPDGIFASKFHGCFVNVIRLKEEVLVILTRMNHNLSTMCGMGRFEYSKDVDSAVITVDRNDVDGHHENDPNGLSEDWEEFCFFILNAMLYLCASNAEVKESSATSSTYIPREKKVGKWSDLEIYECGYAYGNTIRLSGESTLSRKSNTTGSQRKPYRPHPVKASWQHYWVGHGEKKERILKFKAPYYVGGDAKVANISIVEEPTA